MSSPLIANIPINLTEALSPAELSQLTELAAREHKPLERVILDALKAFVAKVAPAGAEATQAAAA